MDDLIIRYLLDELPPDQRESFEQRLAAGGAESVRLRQWRDWLSLLPESRDSAPPPPPDLTLRTLARTAEYAVAHGMLDQLCPRPAMEVPHRDESPRSAKAEVARPRFPDSSDPWYPTWWRRADLAIAGVIAFLAIGVGLVGLEKLRHTRQVNLCQDQLRQVHQGLVSYSDAYGGRFPQVGTPRVPVAGAFLSELGRTGHLPASHERVCPAMPAITRPGSQSGAATALHPVGYAYSLGYLDPAGQLQGLRRETLPSDTVDWHPIAGDLPGPPSPLHRRGQNVLYTGGTVRFMATPHAGVQGDHIYQNAAGLVRAGLHAQDAVLGQGENTP